MKGPASVCEGGGMSDGSEPAGAPEIPWSPPGDGILEILGSVANDSDFEMSLTVTVPGGTVTGTLIGYRKWLEGARQLFAALSPGVLKPWIDDEQAYQEEYKRLGDDAPERDVWFLHLRDAHVIDSAGMVPSEGS